MIIAFAHTTGALLAGVKTVTRREWADKTAAYFVDMLSGARIIPRQRRANPDGVLVDAYDKSPRNGGKKVATIRVTSVVKESLALMPEGDYQAEGFAWLDGQEITPGGIGDPWRVHRGADFVRTWRDYFLLAQNREDRTLWAVRFTLVEVVS